MKEIEEYTDDFDHKHSFKILYDKIIKIYFPDSDQCIKEYWKSFSQEEREMLEELAALHQIMIGGGDGSMVYLYCKHCGYWIRTWNLLD